MSDCSLKMKSAGLLLYGIDFQLSSEGKNNLPQEQLGSLSKAQNASVEDVKNSGPDSGRSRLRFWGIVLGHERIKGIQGHLAGPVGGACDS